MLTQINQIDIFVWLMWWVKSNGYVNYVNFLSVSNLGDFGRKWLGEFGVYLLSGHSMSGESMIEGLL